MDRRNLPLTALRAFETVGKHLNMGRAGEELGVTHGAISHQIRLLEERLGTQLFSRANNKLALTPTGTRLLGYVTEGLDRILEGTRYLDPESLSGPLIVGCTETIASCWATKQICEFNEQYPTITIEIREIEPRQEIIPRDMDVAICYGAPEQDDRELTSLGAPMLYPVCSPTLLQQRKNVTRGTDILNFTLIHDQQVPWSKWFEHYGVDDADVSRNIYFPTTSQALGAAILGYGVALANTLETQELIRDGRLVRLMEKPVEEEAAYYMLSPAAGSLPLKSQIFCEWVMKTCSYS